MGLGWDIHLSAFRIAPATVKRIEHLGFARDEFANNTRCLASEYHGTYRGKRQLPDDGLWNETCQLLLADGIFRGCLEEESIDPRHQREMDGKGCLAPSLLPQLRHKEVPAGKQKACDLHIGVELGRSPPAAIEQLESLKIASFEKPIPDGIRRVYTITCETVEDGEKLFDVLQRHLSQVPDLRGKMKLERTTRCFRHPDDAPVLPLTTREMVSEWIASVSASQAKMILLK